MFLTFALFFMVIVGVRDWSQWYNE